MDRISPEKMRAFARMALNAIGREYPNQIRHVLMSDADLKPPRELTPIFFGCFDWHSAVHSHWSLVRILRLFSDNVQADEISAALDRSFTPERAQGELEYLRGPERGTFEVPYGLAWLVQLGAELVEFSTDPRGKRWHSAIEPIVALAAERLDAHIRRLPRPVRSGEHLQTAFSMGLYLDWAKIAKRSDFAERAAARARELYGSDRDGPLHLEPSGYDFLSPCFGEADVMRRVLEPRAFADWLSRFLPELPRTRGARVFEPVSCPDPADGRLAHLDGLNLSRAWMLEGVAAGLPPDDERREPLLESAVRHAESGLAAVTGEHYAGAHWQASFAVYLATRRGTS